MYKATNMQEKIFIDVAQLIKNITVSYCSAFGYGI